MPTALSASAAWLVAAALAAVPMGSTFAVSPAAQPGRAAYNTCPGSYDVSKSAGIRTASGVRWGTSYLKLRKSTEKKAFCGKVVIPKRFRNKQAVITYSAENFTAGGQKLGELSGQMFGSRLTAARYYGNGFVSGEYVVYRISMAFQGHHATARTLRVTLP